MDECPEMHVGDMGERQPADFDIAEGDLWQDGSLSQAACEDDDTFLAGQILLLGFRVSEDSSGEF